MKTGIDPQWEPLGRSTEEQPAGRLWAQAVKILVFPRDTVEFDQSNSSNLRTL